MKKKFKWILTGLILTGGAYYFSQKGPELSLLYNLTFEKIALALSVILFSYLFRALQFKNLFTAVGLKLSFNEWWGLTHVMKLGNLLMFKSGTVTTAYYLKNKKPFFTGPTGSAARLFFRLLKCCLHTYSDRPPDYF